MTIERISTLSPENIHETVEAQASQRGFALLHTYVYHDILEGKGFPITRKVFIYELCNAATASKMLTSHPGIAPFMPCRLAVYTDDAGQTRLSTIDMAPLLAGYGLAPKLEEEARSLFGSLMELMDQYVSGKQA